MSVHCTLHCTALYSLINMKNTFQIKCSMYIFRQDIYFRKKSKVCIFADIRKTRGFIGEQQIGLQKDNQNFHFAHFSHPRIPPSADICLSRNISPVFSCWYTVISCLNWSLLVFCSFSPVTVNCGVQDKLVLVNMDLRQWSMWKRIIVQWPNNIKLNLLKSKI